MPVSVRRAVQGRLELVAGFDAERKALGRWWSTVLVLMNSCALSSNPPNHQHHMARSAGIDRNTVIRGPASDGSGWG